MKKLIGVVFLVSSFLISGCGSSKGGGGGGGTTSKASLAWTGGSTLNAGNVTIFSTSTASISLKNSGSVAATSMTMANPTAPFSFAGSAYPGTGGTCGTSLAVGASCTLVFTYTAAAPITTNNQFVSLTFNDGTQSTSLALTLKATTAVGPFNQVKGLDGTGSVLLATSTAVYVGGSFAGFGNTPAGGIARIVNGTIDPSFAIGTGATTGTTVKAIAVDASGNVYVGGSFTTFNGTAAGGIVRLTSTGAIDTTFVTGAGATGGTATVNTIALATDGSNDIYLGGNFTAYATSNTVGNIVRVTNTGSYDSTFVQGTGFNGNVNAIVPVPSSTSIYVGGNFTGYGASSPTRVARIGSNGTFDGTFTASANANVTSLALATDGSNFLYIGGSFATVNAAAPARITRVNTSGTVDGTWNAGPGAGFSNNAVNSISVATDGSNAVYVTGTFSANYNGSAVVPRIVRLTSSGIVDAGFSAGTGLNSTGNAIAAAQDGSGAVYAAGLFQTYNGSSADRLVRIKSTGAIDTSLNTIGGFNGAVSTVAAAVDGTYNVYVGGSFSNYNGTTTNNLARLTRNGVLDTTFTSGGGALSTVNSIVPATDGSGYVYVGGGFTTLNGTGINYFARVKNTGPVDGTFSAGVNSTVAQIATAPSSTAVYAVGSFTAPSSFLARFTSTGSADGAYVVGAFSATPTVSVVAPAVDGSGKVYVGGTFTSYGGSASNNITRTTNGGTVDTTFAGTGAAGFNGAVTGIAPQSDGTTYVIGSFTSYNGTGTGTDIVRLSSAGVIDATFVTGTGFLGGVPNAITLATDGSKALYVGGPFTGYNGTTLTGMVRLTNAGTVDTTFVTGTGMNAAVSSLSIATDGTYAIYAGGSFTSYAGSANDNLCRIESTGAMD